MPEGVKRFASVAAAIGNDKRAILRLVNNLERIVSNPDARDIVRRFAADIHAPAPKELARDERDNVAHYEDL